MLFLSIGSIRFPAMKRLLLLLCLSAAVRPTAAQTAVSGFVRSLPERLARPLDDTLVVLRDLELLASCCRSCFALEAENDLDCNFTLTDTDAV